MTTNMKVSVLIHPMDKLVFHEFDLSKALELKNATHAQISGDFHAVTSFRRLPRDQFVQTGEVTEKLLADIGK